jgi:hypothetical protein
VGEGGYWTLDKVVVGDGDVGDAFTRRWYVKDGMAVAGRPAAEYELGLRHDNIPMASIPRGTGFNNSFTLNVPRMYQALLCPASLYDPVVFCSTSMPAGSFFSRPISFPSTSFSLSPSSVSLALSSSLFAFGSFSSSTPSPRS